MISTLLFPSDVFERKKVDPDMKREYDAAIDTCKYEMLLFDYDAWFNHAELKLTQAVNEEKQAIYRGWMMTPEQYQDFYTQLLKANVRLITTPEMYSHLHIFPNAYPEIVDDTARIMTFPLHKEINIEKVKTEFSRFMVKDFVKSVKGTEFPSSFDNSIDQAEFNRWMEVFYKYRGELLTGGICIKEFLHLKKYDEKTNEYRVYYANHDICSVSRNSLQGIYTPEPPKGLIDKYRYLPSIFYTIDFAELEDGSWKIIECGDGSVSGLSDKQDYYSFYRSLYYCLN